MPHPREQIRAAALFVLYCAYHLANCCSRHTYSSAPWHIMQPACDEASKDVWRLSDCLYFFHDFLPYIAALSPIDSVGESPLREERTFSHLMRVGGRGRARAKQPLFFEIERSSALLFEGPQHSIDSNPVNQQIRSVDKTPRRRIACMNMQANSFRSGNFGSDVDEEKIFISADLYPIRHTVTEHRGQEPAGIHLLVAHEQK